MTPWFTSKDYNSKEGMMTKVWGPPLWHVLHNISFNYPIHPTAKQQRQYLQFINSLQHVLPCCVCRENFQKAMQNDFPFRVKDMKTRASFSRRMYDLHEYIRKHSHSENNKSPTKVSYEEVRDYHESFRARPGAPLKRSILHIKSIPTKTKRVTLKDNTECVKKVSAKTKRKND